MKKIVFLLVIFLSLFAREYSIIAFSTKKFNKNEAVLFIKRFPNGIVKQYTKYVEYKIEPFKSYKEAKNFLKKVKRYYRKPFIVVYNPYLGKILFPLKGTEKKRIESVNGEIRKTPNGLVYCKTKCGCRYKKYSWEINKTRVLNKINLSVKDYLAKTKKETSTNNLKHVVAIAPLEQNKGETNETNETYGCRYSDSSDYIFYIDLYGNLYRGQKYIKRLYGDSENIKLGFMYEKYFWNYWKFFTDDRVILSRKNRNGKVSEDVYLDVNELYLRSFCINCDLTNILIGRKNTKDFRSWWYEQRLDEIKIFSENYLFNYEMIFAKRIGNNVFTDDSSPKARIKGSKFFIFHTNYQYRYKNNIDFYYIYELSKLKEFVKRRRLSFLGIGADGYYKDVFYWLNAGYSGGKIEKRNGKDTSDGYGFDIGVKIPYSARLSFAAGYAFGSGGDYFTQPIIATDHSDYLHKGFSFKYYGNILDPVLENLHILSFYGIYDINEYKALIGAFHKYRQDVTKAVVYNDRYVYATNGKNKDVGEEFDVIYQYLNRRYEKLKIGLGIFLGGGAYNYLKDKNAYRIFVNYRRYWK